MELESLEMIDIINFEAEKKKSEERARAYRQRVVDRKKNRIIDMLLGCGVIGAFAVLGLVSPWIAVPGCATLAIAAAFRTGQLWQEMGK